MTECKKPSHVRPGFLCVRRLVLRRLARRNSSGRDIAGIDVLHATEELYALFFAAYIVDALSERRSGGILIAHTAEVALQNLLGLVAQPGRLDSDDSAAAADAVGEHAR